MNEPHIQTIRGAIECAIYRSEGHWIRTPKTSGFYYHHELYGYIPVSEMSKLIRGDWNKNHTEWEEYAWLCYENRYLTLEQLASQMLDCGTHTEFSTSLHETFKQKYQMESHHTVAKVFIDVDGIEYRSI